MGERDWAKMAQSIEVAIIISRIYINIHIHFVFLNVTDVYVPAHAGYLVLYDIPKYICLL